MIVVYNSVQSLSVRARDKVGSEVSPSYATGHAITILGIIFNSLIERTD